MLFLYQRSKAFQARCVRIEAACKQSVNGTSPILRKIHTRRARKRLALRDATLVLPTRSVAQPPSLKLRRAKESDVYRAMANQFQPLRKATCTSRPAKVH